MLKKGKILIYFFPYEGAGIHKSSTWDEWVMDSNLHVWSARSSLWANVPLMECSPFAGSATEITLGWQSGRLVLMWITSQPIPRGLSWSYWLRKKKTKVQCYTLRVQALPSQTVYCLLSCGTQPKICPIDNGDQARVRHGLSWLWPTSVGHWHCVLLFSNSPSSFHSGVNCTHWEVKCTLFSSGHLEK